MQLWSNNDCKSQILGTKLMTTQQTVTRDLDSESTSSADLLMK